jgi:hypothetical protein
LSLHERERTYIIQIEDFMGDKSYPNSRIGSIRLKNSRPILTPGAI